MGKKLKLPFLFNNTTTDTRSWPWPSCNQPRTLSFRAGDIFRTINSAYLAAETQTPESWFTTSPASPASSVAEETAGGELTEIVIRGIRSERLFFEPGETSSILEEGKSAAASGEDETASFDEGLVMSAGGSETATFKESLAMSVESREPLADFRRSMEEMVSAHGLKDWESLEDLLCCYLKVNGKHNHDYIVGAFVDLLVGLAVDTPTAINCASSSSSTPSSSHNHHHHHHHHIDSPISPLFLYNSSESSSSSLTTIAACVSSSRGDREIREQD